MNTLDHKVTFQRQLSRANSDLFQPEIKNSEDILNSLKSSKTNSTETTKNSIIWAVAWRPDGRKLAISQKNNVILYDYINEKLEYADQFSGPKSVQVTTIAWSFDSRQLAFGCTNDGDPSSNQRAPVVIYELNSDSNVYKGKLKFHHDSAVQCLSYKPNPGHTAPNKLICCAVEDYSMWDANTSQIQKANVESKVVCVDWHSSGSLLAMGHHSGRISIRDGTSTDLRELYRVDRPSNGPIWSLKFKKELDSKNMIIENACLAFVDWGKRLCCIDWKGSHLIPEVQLSHDPTFLEWHDPDSIIVGDMGGNLDLYTSSNGAFIKRIWKTANKNCWITAGQMHPKKVRYSKNTGKTSEKPANSGEKSGDQEKIKEITQETSKSELLAVCDKNGNLTLISSKTNNTSATYKKLYAFTEKMTSVVIKNLVEDHIMKIQCNELVLGIGLNRRLCVILTKGGVGSKSIRLTTWELMNETRYDQRKQVSLEDVKLNKSGAKNLDLKVVGCTNKHVILVQGDFLKSYLLESGALDREWKFSKNDKNFEKTMKNENKQDSQRILGETSSEADKENPHVMYEVKSGEKTPDSGENLELNPASAITSCFLTSTSEIYLSTNYEIYRISLNSTIPVPIIACTELIKSIKLSSRSKYLAIQFENLTLQLYKLHILKNTNELLFQEPSVTSFRFHESLDKLIGYTKTEESQLQIRVISEDSDSGSGSNHHTGLNSGINPAIAHPTSGEIVGFVDSKIYNIPLISGKNSDPVATEVLQSALLRQMVESGNYKMGYSLANLGVTDSDWRFLAEKCLIKSSFESLEVARKCYTRLSDLVNLSIVEELVAKYMKNGSEVDEKMQSLCRAEVCGYLGRFDEAVEAYRSAGKIGLARRMFLDLRMFEKAKQFDNLMEGEDSGMGEDVQDEAKWAEDNGDVDRAIEIYLNTKSYTRAIDLLAHHNLTDKLIQTARRKLAPTDTEALLQTVAHLKILLKSDEKRMFALCIEFLEKANQHSELVNILCKKLDWARAHQVAENCQNMELIEKTWFKHATWLAENDQFNAAQKAFIQANKPVEAIKVLKTLTKNAIQEFRFLDASSYFYKISQNSLKESDFKNFEENQKLALIYYLYDIIYEYSFQPFMTHECDENVLFHAARWLWFELEADTNKNYENIDYVAVLYTLSQKATQLGAYKVARLAHDKLRTLKLPGKLRNRIEQDGLLLFSKPFNDCSELSIDCPRCDASNQIFPIQMSNLAQRSYGKYSRSNQGNNNNFSADSENFDMVSNSFYKTLGFCQSCGQVFIMSLASFEVLPVVEFYLDPELETLSESEVRTIIGSSVTNHQNNSNTLATTESNSSVKPADSNATIAASSNLSVDRLTLTDITEMQDLNSNVLNLQKSQNSLQTTKSNMNPINLDNNPEDDLFTDLLNRSLCSADSFTPVVVDRIVLSSLKPHEVLISKCLNRETRYFKNLIPEIPLAIFDNCLFGGLASKSDVEVLNIFTNRPCPFFN